MMYLVSTERLFTPIATHSHHIPDCMYGGIYLDIYIVYIGNMNSSHKLKFKGMVGSSQ